MPLRERLGRSLRTLREARKRTVLGIGALLGDQDAKKRLELIEEFKKRTGAKYVSPYLYNRSAEYLELRLKQWENRIEEAESRRNLLQRGVRVKIAEREITLGEGHRAFFDALANAAKDNDWAGLEVLAPSMNVRPDSIREGEFLRYLARIHPELQKIAKRYGTRTAAEAFYLFTNPELHENLVFGEQKQEGGSKKEEANGMILRRIRGRFGGIRRKLSEKLRLRNVKAPAEKEPIIKEVGTKPTVEAGKTGTQPTASNVPSPAEIPIRELIEEAHARALAMLPEEDARKAALLDPEIMHRAMYEVLRRNGIITNKIRADPKTAEEIKKILATAMIRGLQRSLKDGGFDREYARILENLKGAELQEKFRHLAQYTDEIGKITEEYRNTVEELRKLRNKVENHKYAVVRAIGNGVFNYTDERQFEQLLKTAERAVKQGRFNTFAEYFRTLYTNKGGPRFKGVGSGLIEDYLRKLEEAEQAHAETRKRLDSIMNRYETTKNSIILLSQDIGKVREQAIRAKKAATVAYNRAIAQELAQELLKAYKKKGFEFVGPKTVSQAKVRGQKW